jgi:hypothetical protein
MQFTRAGALTSSISGLTASVFSSVERDLAMIGLYHATDMEMVYSSCVLNLAVVHASNPTMVRS